MTLLLPDARGHFVESSRQPDVVAKLEHAYGALAGENYRLREQLEGVEHMLDEKGWHQAFAHGADGGLTLRQIKLASAQLRELVVGNPLLKRGVQLRVTYVWGGGCEYSALTAGGKPTTLTAEVRNLIDQPTNFRYLFSNGAHEEFERAASTDGNLFLLGDDATKVMQRVPMDQITGDLRNPDNLEEIWMFRREWTAAGAGQDVPPVYVRWYYTDAYVGIRHSRIEVAGGNIEPVDTTKTMLHVAFNQQVGWAYGIPDALPVIAFLKLYREFLKSGYVMSKALATIAYRVTTSSAGAVERAAAQITLPGQNNAAVMSAGNDIGAVTTAGKGYDFASGKPLAATVAAGLEVSVDALLAENTTDTLDITAKASALMRRLTWEDAFRRIFRQLGSTRKLVCTWSDLPVEQIQRQMQAWTLARASGAFKGEVIQKGMARVLNIADPGDLPDDYSSSPASTNPNDGGTTGAGGATDGTGQGQNTPTGGSGNSDSRKGNE